MSKPSFLITIDTEGDNLWGCPEEVTTENARFLPRFQELLEKFGLRPTYLTNWEMCHSPAFQDLGRDVLRRGVGEIGMHLHGWDTPPLEPLTDDDRMGHPFLTEYPEALQREKVRRMTEALEDVFGVAMRSHRGGRWAFDEAYAGILASEGYWVDCSLTPLMEWIDEESGGGRPVLDYRDVPLRPYFLDLRDVGREGSSSLLEVPMTITPRGRGRGWVQWLGDQGSKWSGGLLDPWLTRPSWLRPDGENLEEMEIIIERARARSWDYAMFMLHSSEFMPGGSPTFQTEQSIEKLYQDMEALFAQVEGRFVPQTLSEFYLDRAPQPAKGQGDASPRVVGNPAEL